MLIHRKEGDWHVWYNEKDEERFRCKIPEGATLQDIERFITHLKRIVEEKGN